VAEHLRNGREGMSLWRRDESRTKEVELVIGIKKLMYRYKMEASKEVA
jgi:hypothetical protein